MYCSLIIDDIRDLLRHHMLGIWRNQRKNMWFVCVISNFKNDHLVILECIKGKHLELIRPKEALSKLFERFFNNLTSISLMMKALNVLHRALQEEDISQMVAHRIKEKENLLYPCQKEDQSYGKFTFIVTL